MLSNKDRELISIGASVAAGCQPCTNFHLRAARIAGASDAEISQAVNEAFAARRHATEVMAQLAAQHVGAPISHASGCEEKPLIGELVSISAARAVNSVPDLETHVAAARRIGATDGQILAAIKIASAVQRTAERKVEEATGRATEGTPREREHCGPRCGCHSQVESQKK